MGGRRCGDRMLETAALLFSLCGPGAVHLAPALHHAAHVHHVRRPLLAALIRVESRCLPDAIGAKGELGLGQIKPGTLAAGDYTRAQLLTPRYNLLATARHLRRRLDLCDGSELRALYVYSGRRYCRDYGKDPHSGRDYARTVLRLAEQASREPES